MNWLFDTSMGSPGLDGRWPTWLTVVFTLSNAISGLGLIAIPGVVLASWRCRRDRISVGEILGILAFLPMLGLSRLIRVAELWGPPYHATTILDCLAAGFTIYSLICLPRLLNIVLKLPARGEVIRQNNNLSDAYLGLALESEELRDRNGELSRSVLDFEYEADGRRWSSDAIESLAKIKELMKPNHEKADNA